MHLSLQDKIVVITGGFGSLGLAAAKAASASGAKVALIDRAPVPTDGRLKDLPESALPLGDVDLTDLQQAQAAAKQIADKFGRIDALLNIAGGFRWETFADNDLDSWDFLFSINVKTAISASKAMLPYLQKEGGAIVCISAGAANKAEVGLGAYAASKAGVSRFVEALSQEVKDQNIRVNAVLPSIIDTPPNRQDMPDAEFDRWVTPEALANVLLFLISDEASAITGAQIPVSNRV